MSFRDRVTPFLLVAACLAAGPASVPAPDAPAISGTVVDSSGRAVQGARVALVPMGLFDPSGARFVQVESAADGSFRFAGSETGRYGVTTTAPNHTAAWVADVEPGRAGLRLQLSNGGRRLSGRVVDRSGRPRAGAEVRLVRGLGDNGDVFLVESAADGRWNATVPEGRYSANAVLGSDYAAAPRAVSAEANSVDLVLDAVWPPGPPPAAVVDWVRAHEIPLATVEPGQGFSDLAPLRAIVGDARAVGLGEATHGTREIFLLKHRILEYLVSELDFNVLAIEIGLPESFAIEDYVLGGPGDAAQLLAGESAVWKTEELRDVIRWMREWNRTHTRKVHFHGLDMRRGGVAARDTLAYLERTDRAMLSAPFVRALAPVADPADLCGDHATPEAGAGGARRAGARAGRLVRESARVSSWRNRAPRHGGEPPCKPGCWRSSSSGSPPATRAPVCSCASAPWPTTPCEPSSTTGQGHAPSSGRTTRTSRAIARPSRR